MFDGNLMLELVKFSDLTG